MENPFSTDLSYVVSVKALREILDGISTEDERWWIDEEKSESVVIGYNDCSQCGLHSSGIHDILFKFPKIASLPFLDGDGEMVCLYPNSRKAVQRGLYWENGNLLNDEVRDWETFWRPIRRAIERKIIRTAPADPNQ